SRRSLMIVFSKNYWGRWADQFHLGYQQLLQLYAQSPLQFAIKHPMTTIFGVAGRVLDWLVLPIGMMCGIWALRKHQEAIICLPFLYTLATLAPLYVTARNTTNAYGAIVPLCAFGLVCLLNEMQKRRVFEGIS